MAPPVMTEVGLVTVGFEVPLTPVAMSAGREGLLRAPPERVLETREVGVGGVPVTMPGRGVRPPMEARLFSAVWMSAARVGEARLSGVGVVTPLKVRVNEPVLAGT